MSNSINVFPNILKLERQDLYVKICTAICYEQGWRAACQYNGQCSETHSWTHWNCSQYSRWAFTTPSMQLQHTHSLKLFQHSHHIHSQNRAKAMKLLQALIYENQRKAVLQERTQKRKQQIGSGERSERIRTYNFPQVYFLYSNCTLSFNLHCYLYDLCTCKMYRTEWLSIELVQPYGEWRSSWVEVNYWTVC